MRRHEDVGMVAQSRIDRQRLGIEDVQCCAGEFTAFHGGEDGVVFDQRAAGHVDQESAVFLAMVASLIMW